MRTTKALRSFIAISIRITLNIFKQCLGADFAGFPLFRRGFGCRRACPKCDGGDGDAEFFCRSADRPSLTKFFEYELFEVFWIGHSVIVPKNMFIYYILQSPQSGFLRISYTVKNLLLFQGARRKSKIYRITKYTEFKKINGARDRNRTGTLVLGATDFKSVVSTNFTTRARYLGCL